MTNKEIIEKLLVKIDFVNSDVYKSLELQGYSLDTILDDGTLVFSDLKSGLGTYIAYEAIIFSHWCAKKVWGDEWRYQLQQMVLKEKPLQYLSQFLD
jgi:hypothetical protein